MKIIFFMRTSDFFSEKHQKTNLALSKPGGRFLGLLLLLTLIFLSSCNMRASNTIILWTDRPEFALYAMFFNASQNSYKVEVRYFEFPAQRLTESNEQPDIVVASWLNSSSIRPLFRDLNDLFRRDGLEHSSFYSRLLSLGNIDNRQYFLPVSFNIPAIIFARDFTQSAPNPFTIDLEEMKQRGKAHNVKNHGSFSQMGFAPSYDDEFLFVVTSLFGSSFREASPIAWENQLLQQGINWTQNWISEANISIQVEEDFTYKFFYTPPDKLVNTGRILFTYMESARFFILPEERRANLDFRWLAANEMIPLSEGNVFFGIHRRTRALPAARAFAHWFFSAETQRLLLEQAKNFRLNETSFGIAGGFSAMRTVTEQVFPQFYPDLLGRMPPESFLSPPNALPVNWLAIKERVILPYLRERIRHSPNGEARPLERRVSDWHRINR